MESVAIEDLATVLISEFVKENKGYLQTEAHEYESKDCVCNEVPFIKMNFEARKRLVTKTLDKLV